MLLSVADIHFIPKQDLKVGRWYIGNGRGTNQAVWNGEVFLFWMIDCGQHVVQWLPHFTDEDYYAAFYPTTELGACDEYEVMNEWYIRK